MSVRKPVTSSDLRDAASQCASWVLHVDPALWDKQAYGLEWIRSRTISHIDDALAFYSRSLASRNTENPGVRGPVLQEGSIEASARQIEAGATWLGHFTLLDNERQQLPSSMAISPLGAQYRL